jgi:hypothetical protein
MKVQFLQSGGLGGLVRGCTLDTETLPRSIGEDLERLVNQSRISGNREDLSDLGRDLHQYDIRVEQGPRKAFLRVDDATVPAAVQPLLGFLKLQAKMMPLRALPAVQPENDWRKVAMDAILSDGEIDDGEVKVLKKELWADGKIDMDEVKFLIDLRNAAQKKAKAKKATVNPKFEQLFFTAISENVLKDGKIDASEAKWLRTMLFADGKIDANEKKFLAKLKKAATKGTSPEFDQLYRECMTKK